MGGQSTFERGSEDMGQVLRIDAPAGSDALLGMEFSKDMTFAQWEAEGRRLSQMSHAVQWYIGDWWNAGFRYGEEKREDTAKRIFGLDYGTVRNLGSVASRIGLSRRRDSVPFSYHVEVASLKDPTAADALLDRADELTVRDLRREVQALKATNDSGVGAIATDDDTDSEPAIRGKVISHELMEAYSWLAKWGGEIEKSRQLERGEADYLALVLDKLGEAYAERSPVPMDFRVVFREQGRLECERVYGVSRLTVNRWMAMCGEQELKDERAAFVKYHRDATHKPKQIGPAPQLEIDTYLPVARMAAEHLRVSRYGGWRVTDRSLSGGTGWLVGTVHKSSEELITMAERQGFDRQAAVTEARQEGY